MKFGSTTFGFVALLILLPTHVFAQTGTNRGSGGTETFTKAQIDAQSKAAAQMIKQDKSCESAPKTPLAKASRAAVQIVHKSLVYPTENGYKITRSPSQYCSGHPLSGDNGPMGALWDKTGKALPSMATLSKPPAPSQPDRDKTQYCSGMLVDPEDGTRETQRTIATAAHCMMGRTPENFCHEFVFVFNRACGSETFSKDEVQECESGKITDSGTSADGFNLHTDNMTKDHAVFRLKKSVPTSVAEALKMRKKRVETGPEHPYYAIGYPGGAQRTVSKLEAVKAVPDESSAPYCYTKFKGYVYRGNSGGPIVDRNGELVGIAASMDDKEAGGPGVREPTVLVKDGKEPFCKTQAAGKPLEVQTVNPCKEVRDDLVASSGLPAQKPVPPAKDSKGVR